MAQTAQLYSWCQLGRGCSKPRPSRLRPRKEIRCQMYRRLYGPRANLEECRKIPPHRDSISVTYIPWRLVVPHRRNLAYNTGGEECNVYSAYLPYKPATKMSHAASLKIKVFHFSLSLQHTNNRLQNTCIFYLLLFNTLAIESFLKQKKCRMVLCPPCAYQVTPTAIPTTLFPLPFKFHSTDVPNINQTCYCKLHSFGIIYYA